LIIIEFIYQIFPQTKKTKLFTITKDSDSYKTFNFHDFSNEHLELNTFIGKIYIENTYGFFVHLNTWYILEMNTVYHFHLPVTIKLINYNNKNIQYYIEDSNVE